MGSFVFKWEHPASEVYVTGTFDDWSKSEKLIKTGDVFEKDVTLSSATEKIYYKFVVDGNWVTDHTAPQENDASGNLNNVLTTDRIIKHTPATVGIMSGVAPTSTTADLAKDVPLEKAASGSSDLPGSFPETPGVVEKGDFSVNPLPAADGAVNPIKLAPGEKVPDPSSFTNHTLTSNVRDDPELVAAAAAKKSEAEQTFSVNPLPAFAGAVNPVTVAPGEKIPAVSHVTGNTVNSGVTLDKESYEKSGGIGNAPVLPPVVTPQNERDQNGTGILDLPPISKNMIPESSLPMGTSGADTFDATPTVQSAGPTSTTAQLAAAVPLESSKVPEVVKESQKEAGVEPEASALPEEVKEKSAVESELLKEVPVAPSTSEGTAGKGTEKTENGITPGEAAAAVGGAAIAVGGAAFAYASGAATNLTSKLPESVQKSIATMNTESTEAVHTLTSKLPTSMQKTISSMTAGSVDQSTAKDTPEIVKESIAASGQGAEAAGNEEAVLEKKAVEKELLAEIKPETSTGEPAPKITTPSGLVAPVVEKPVESRDVSPGTVPGSHTQTASTTPAKKITAPASSSNVADSTAGSSTTDKKKKRTSIFNKLKAKFSHKD